MTPLERLELLRQARERSARRARRARLRAVKSGEPMDAPGNRRIVKTARTAEAINAAAREGLWPLVKAVVPREAIGNMVAVFQNPETGEIEASGDTRWPPRGNLVIDYMRYYPYHFPNPFAAYLLPRDMAEGEEVWLEDLIEDVVAVWGNQGHRPRLAAAPAVWNGSDFEILFDEEADAEQWIG